ncbi:MAG: methyltransferase domain-containing protein [Gammaproteobacteria bacterium]|nr:methyltransferase domain-containing protein [Gammaproteobacteria bacterium]
MYQGDFYTAFHAPRYERLLKLIDRYSITQDSSVLDVGSSKLTELIHSSFKCKVDALGLTPHGHGMNGEYYPFDLNRVTDTSAWPVELPSYDLIVFAEVIEHLYTAPELVLAFLRAHMNSGAVLIIQTPNAATLGNRIRLLLGKNPYEKIRVNERSPGHFREYTVQELHDYATVGGMSVDTCFVEYYVDVSYRARSSGTGIVQHSVPTKASRLLHRLYLCVFAVMPKSLCPGITVVLQLVR